MELLAKLWFHTKDIAATYTGTFVVVMILNQLLFFGFCLNPVCLIAAMPHVLLITVVAGTFISKVRGWGEKPLGLAKKLDRFTENLAEEAKILELESERFVRESKVERDTRIAELEKLIEEGDTNAGSSSIRCPKCHSLMEKRLARKGKYAGKNFFGCSQYPKCKGIVNIP